MQEKRRNILLYLIPIGVGAAFYSSIFILKAIALNYWVDLFLFPILYIRLFISSFFIGFIELLPGSQSWGLREGGFLKFPTMRGDLVSSIILTIFVYIYTFFYFYGRLPWQEKNKH